MGYIPKDAEWYIAELVMEITVHDASCNVVHLNLTLIHGSSPEEAYRKAGEFGLGSETSYLNPKNQEVEIRFKGISRLDVIHESLEDGAELAYQERLGLSADEIRQMIPAKDKLAVFVPSAPSKDRDPDYRAAYVVEKVIELCRNSGTEES